MIIINDIFSDAAWYKTQGQNITDLLSTIEIYENYTKIVSEYNNESYFLENKNKKIQYLLNDIISMRISFEYQFK